jgi:hypothetical protein
VIKLPDLLSSAVNYVISARPETGKSTLLKHIALGLARTPVVGSGCSVPVIIHFGTIRGYVNHIETTIRQELPELPTGLTTKMALERGMLVILVDDVDFSQTDKRDTLIRFVSMYPKCRYIFTSSTAFVEAATLRPEIAPDVPFTRVRMRPFRKGQLLALVENHGLTDPMQADRMVERVMRDASALNVPLTAVTGTFLIQIIQEEPAANIINQAALIERYIEMLLQKYAPRELIPGTFDFRNKSDLLCHIVEEMVRTGECEPDENHLLSQIISYLENYGLDYSARDIFDYFIASRIIERHGSRVRFRLRVFFEFFAATRMIDSQEFKEFVFSPDNYLSVINEIGFYSALNRKDMEKIGYVYGEFVKLTNSIWPVGGTVVDAEKQLSEMAIPGRETTESELYALQRQLRTPEQIERDRQDLLDGSEFANDENRQMVSRVIYVTPEERWNGHLVLLSGMIKHMELIKDTEKRRILDEVIAGWVRLTTNSLGVVSELSLNRRVVFNGITYTSSLPDGLSVGEMARRLALYMPIAVARMATIFLGTEKLKNQLEDGLGVGGKSPGQQFIRASVLADLGVKGIAEIAERVGTVMSSHKYLSHVFARKMYEIAVHYRLEKSEAARLDSVVGDMFAVSEKGQKGKSTKRKSDIINGIQQQKLQIGLERGSGKFR